MADRNLQDLLKWSIANSEPNATTDQASRSLNPEALQALFSGGPSDAELMRAAMEAIEDPSVDLENKLIAFDNFEQLIENLDNANNMENLSLWTPLLKQLEHVEPEIRKMAAWCVGTAVQNNDRSQERLLAMGGIPPLVHMATSGDEKKDVRRKAVYALSSGTRNYQPAMDVMTDELEKKGKSGARVDATNMDAVDAIMNGLRDDAAKAV